MDARGSLTELMSNAYNWGDGIDRINLYYAPKGIVVEIIQNKEWDVDKIWDTFRAAEEGLHPTSDSRGYGGGGFSTVTRDKYEMNHTGKATLLLMDKKSFESILNRIKEYRKSRK